MNTPKEKNSVWYLLLLLPIVASILVTIGGILAIVGFACLVLWILIFKGSLNAFNSGYGALWFNYLPFFSKHNIHNQSVTPPQPVTPPRPVTPPQPVSFNQPATGRQMWNQTAPAFNKQRLTATIESLKWTASDVNTLVCEAGENLQYGLAFRSQYGNVMPHTQRLDSVQMSEIAAKISGNLPHDAVCRAWPLYELSKGLNMDGLLVVPDKNRPLGLYLIIAGDSVKSIFTIFSMFVPVCSGKAEWVRKIHQPSPDELRNEKELATLILKLSEQIVA